jgi:hypothetical protein
VRPEGLTTAIIIIIIIIVIWSWAILERPSVVQLLNLQAFYGTRSLITVYCSENAKLLFLSLLDARYFPMYRTSFSEKAFLCLKENYGVFSDYVALKNELLVMFSDPDIAKDSVYDLHQYTSYVCSSAIMRFPTNLQIM